MDKSLAEIMLQYGGLGVVVIVVAWAYWKKDSQKNAESAARIADAQANAEQNRNLAERSISSIERFTDVTEALVRELRYERLGTNEDPAPPPPVAPRYDPRRDPEPSALRRPPTGQPFTPRRRSNPDWNPER